MNPATVPDAHAEPPVEEPPRESPEPGPAPKAARVAGGRALALLAVVACLLSLLLPIASSGVWDPPELQTAELGRRIAVNLLGGGSLAVEGANNSVPTRGDLGKGELPFTSIALGFRVFGLHDWAGRLPLALFGLFGAACIYLLVHRLADRRAAAYSVLVLVTMPLYYLHARTMLGDIVTMAAGCAAVAGLGLALFDSGRRRRALALLLGALGLVAGFLSRGILVGVAGPLLGVGAAFAALRLARALPGDRTRDALAGLVLLLGVLASGLGLRVLFGTPDPDERVSVWLGAAWVHSRNEPTFDALVLQLGHALFPWSALLPLALGRLLRASPAANGRDAELGLRALVIAAATFAALIHGLSATMLGVQPFAAVGVLAVACGLCLRDIELGDRVSRALPMLVAALCILLLDDFRNIPEKVMSAYCVADTHFPESFKSIAERWLTLGTLGFVGVFFFSLQEDDTGSGPRFDLAEYRAWPRALGQVWGGNLQFVLLVAIAGLFGVAGLGKLSDRFLHWRVFRNLDQVSREAALYTALGLCAAALLPSVLMLLRDVFRTLHAPGFGSRLLCERFPRLFAAGLPRARLALLAGVGFGLGLSLWFYPALAAQISPRGVFASFREQAGADDELRMIGAGADSAAYYAGRRVQSFSGVPLAFNWLVTGPGRRWLVIRAADLPLLNSLFREHAQPAQNLPVLDARSSEILLVSNRLGGSENHNPFDRMVLSSVPTPQHPVDANFGDALDTLGWDIQRLDGTRVESVAPGREYVFVIYYRVRAPIKTQWETFIHIDGFQRRFNADHPTLQGKYPLNLWRTGDYIADRHEFELEPNFSAGDYRVYFGLFTGEKRFEVRRGRQQENRVEAGVLKVR